MDFLMLVNVFIFGTIVGSFLNVVVYRYNSGRSPLTGRSQCFSCGKTLSWYELVPVFSFLVQGGRCRKCKTKLSWQYPLVEVLSGIIFVSVFMQSKSMVETALLLSVFSTLLVIAVYDLRHQIIPDGLAILFAVLGLAQFFILVDISRAFQFPHVWTLIAGPMLFLPFWLLWFVSQGRWIGLGDGKLAWGIGWFLGAALGGSAVILAFWIGAAYALCIMTVQKFFTKTKDKLSLKSEIPFGPFLILATIIVYFTGVNFFDGSVNLLTFL
ncbi:MAG: prepilin peptidase [bacterium]|nr:prepilin peptidase [bacterium]